MQRSGNGCSSSREASEPRGDDRESLLAKVEWSDDAARSVEEIHDYIALDRPIAARTFVTALMRLGDSLESFPDRGRSIRGEMRELTRIRPYIIRYRHDRDASLVEIVSIWHGARQTP